MVASLNVINSQDHLHGSPGFSPSTCNSGGQCGNGLEKIYPTCAVRYGYMNYIGEFKYAPNMLFGCGQKVVIQTERGIEIGQQVSLTCGGCDKSVKRSTMLEYVKNSGPDFMRPKSGRILRSATVQDLDEDRHIRRDADQKLLRGRNLAREKGLSMKFVACEHLFGGERVIFHFMSDNRIDFRDLVRDLAHEYHTRIEMHQVGARDEARLVADYEICGRECCCKNFLKTLRPVTMRMAKLQKATLDPSKVSGRCGRLRCCLRYEHVGYEELNKQLPRVGTRVQTDRGIGTIKDRQVLTQLLSIEYDTDMVVETMGSEFVTILDKATAPAAPIRQQDGNRNQGGSRGGGPPQGRSEIRRETPPPFQHEPDAADADEGETEYLPEAQSDQPAEPRPPQQSSPQQPGQGRRRRRGRRGRRGRHGPDGPPGPSGDGNRPPSGPPAGPQDHQ